MGAQVGINPTQNDIGSKVIYRAHRDAEPEEGVITSFNEFMVFVRYGSDTHSKGTRRWNLEWLVDYVHPANRT